MNLLLLFIGKIKEDIMEGLMNLFVSFANWFWGPPILILIGFGGIYLTFMTVTKYQRAGLIFMPIQTAHRGLV